MLPLRRRPARPTPLHTALVFSLHAVLVFCLIGISPRARAQQAPVPPPSARQGNCTHPDPATRPDCPGAIAFLQKFQDALKRNDRSAVASLVHYPLLTTAGGKKHIQSRAQLLANFDHIFNASIRAAILKATPDDVWGNSHGFMIGRGVIWFDAIVPRNQAGAPSGAAKYPFKLITVNPVYP